MYIAQEIADRIKTRAKTQKVQLKDMLSDCNMNINLISQFSKGGDIGGIKLARIADYLDCSVDYLLGRTDNPEVNR